VRYDLGMKKLAIIAVVVVCGLVGWRLVHRSPAAVPADSRSELITDRIWIDHVPRSERDTIHVFAALSGEAMGVFQTASAWQGQYEGFRFESQGSELRVVFPQSGKRERIKAIARECDEHGMDYCLELKGSSHGVKRYYSHEGWEIGSLADEHKLVDKLAHAQ
jgi:hypothetical protein